MPLKPEQQDYADAVSGATSAIWDQYGPPALGINFDASGVGGAWGTLEAPGSDLNASAWDIAEAARNRLDELNRKSSLEPGDYTEQQDLIGALQAIADAEAALDASSLTEAEKKLVRDHVPGWSHGTSSTELLRQEILRAAEEAEEFRNLEAPESSGVDQAATIRTAYQCYLLWNINYFSEIHRNLLISGAPTDPGYRGLYAPSAGTAGASAPARAALGAPAADPNADAIQTLGYFKRRKDEPRMYLAREDEDAASMINRLRICPGNEDFSEIRTHEYAQLMPLLKIYKVDRGEKEEKLVEMDFENRTRVDGITETLMTNQPIGGPTSTYSRGVGSGIKSFDWTFLGSDPFTATRDIKATLKLYFQHFSTLTEQREGPNLYDNGKTVKYKYLDLIVQPDCRLMKADATIPDRYSNVFAPECYEIRVDVGYHEPSPHADLPPKLKEYICCQREQLYLTPVDHTFDFRPDGTMELTIQYRGRLNSMMRDKKFNVLIPGGGFANITVEDPDNPGGSPMISLQTVEQLIIDEKAKVNPNQDVIRKNQRIKDIFFTQTRQILYAGILDRLMEKKMIHQHQIPVKDFAVYQTWRSSNYATRLPAPLPRTSVSAAPSAGSVEDFKLAGIEADLDPESDDIDADLTKYLESGDIEERLVAASKKRKYMVDYVFLGDLIATVTANVLGDEMLVGRMLERRAPWPGSLQSMKLGLDEFMGVARETDIKTGALYGKWPYILDPQKLRGLVDNFHLILGNVDIVLPGESSSTYINLAHIPISLASFQDFMIKNIISQDKTYYSYFEFLDDLVSELVTGMLTSECFGGMLSVTARTGATLITSKSEVSSGMFEKRTGDKYRQLSIGNSTPDSPAFDLCNKDMIQDIAPKDYLVLDVINTHPKFLAGTRHPLPGLPPGGRGDPIGDKARGILHFSYGMDRGLLKTAQFSKTDQEYLPEARYANEGALSFNQLSNVYEATFNMMGNNIFIPGMHIYFDPASVGAGMPWQRQEDSSGNIIKRSWSNIMGLGGYHMVTEIGNSIKPGSFNTTVKARHVTSGKIHGTTAPRTDEIAEVLSADTAASELEAAYGAPMSVTAGSLEQADLDDDYIYGVYGSGPTSAD